MRAGRRDRDRRERRRSAVAGHRQATCIEHQGECPANAGILELLVLMVEDEHRQRGIGMGVREPGEPAPDGVLLLDDREHALRREVVDHVQIAVAHLDQPIVDRHVVAVDDVLRRRFSEVGNGRAVPVLALLPDVPVAVGVVAVQHIGPKPNRICVVVLDQVLDTGEDVLRHDPGALPAHREDRMEPRVGSLEREVHGLVVHRLDGFDLGRELATPVRPRRVDLGLHGEDDVVSGELLTVAPVDVVAQVHRHLGEIGVVDRWPGRE